MLVQSSIGKPAQVNLRRATSAAYYALFHRMARSGADLLVGGKNSAKSKHAWVQTYRGLEHGNALNACKNGRIILKFPKAIEDFANAFVSMQEKRHLADYDPQQTFTKSEVLTDIANVKSVIANFEMLDKRDRRAFCAYVLFKARKR